MLTSEQGRENVWFKSPSVVRSPSSVVESRSRELWTVELWSFTSKNLWTHGKKLWKWRASKQGLCDNGNYMTNFCTSAFVAPASEPWGQQRQLAAAAKGPGLVLESSRLWRAMDIGLNKRIGQFIILLFTNRQQVTCSCLKMSSH